jgi:hypothetical protein
LPRRTRIFWVNVIHGTIPRDGEFAKGGAGSLKSCPIRAIGCSNYVAMHLVFSSTVDAEGLLWIVRNTPIYRLQPVLNCEALRMPAIVWGKPN